MKGFSFLVKLGVAGFFLSILVLSYEKWMGYNRFLENIGPLLLYSMVFLLLSTFVVGYILNQKIKKYFQIGLILISLPILLLCSGGLFGLLPLLKWDLEGALFYLLYWGAWGISFGFFFGLPIYLIVIYLLYRDDQKQKGEGFTDLA